MISVNYRLSSELCSFLTCIKDMTIFISKHHITQCAINSEVNCTPVGVSLPILKLHSIIAVTNLLAHNNLWLCFYGQVSKFGRAKMECSFEMGK